MRRVGFGVLVLLLAAGAALAAWTAAPRGPEDPGTFRRRAGSLVRIDTLEGSRTAGGGIEEVVLTGSSGLRVAALIRKPAEGTPSPFPAFVLLGGLHTGRRAALAVPLDAPLLVASIDYVDPPPRRMSVPRALVSLPALRRSAENSVAGALLLLDYLERRPDVDPSRTVVAGGSLGAMVAAIAGGIEPRFEGVVLLYGGGDLRALAEAALPFRSGAARKATAWALSPWLTPLDPAGFVPRIAPRPLLMVNGERDEQIPRRCVVALFEAAGEPRTLVWMSTPHVIQGKPDLTAAVADTVLAWMGERGLLEP